MDKNWDRHTHSTIAPGHASSPRTYNRCSTTVCHHREHRVACHRMQRSSGEHGSEGSEGTAVRSLASSVRSALPASLSFNVTAKLSMFKR